MEEISKHTQDWYAIWKKPDRRNQTIELSTDAAFIVNSFIFLINYFYNLSIVDMDYCLKLKFLRKFFIDRQSKSKNAYIERFSSPIFLKLLFYLNDKFYKFIVTKN